MAISYIYTGQPMAGTENDDFVIGYQGSTFTNANTINGNGGDDWVMADAGNTLIPDRNTTNGAIGTALALDSSSLWTTDENPTIGNTFVPHATAIVEATIGQAEYFSVTVGAGHTLTVDIDYGQSGPIGPSEDLIVEILNGAGTILATFDDSLITDGGLGSYAYNSLGNSRDPYGAYVAPAAGLYYIRVRPYGDGPSGTFSQNSTFVLNVSVSGHSTTSNSVMGSDIISGGEGDDQLFGQGAADTIDGGAGNDLIHGGSGADIITGGVGDDVLYGGGGDDQVYGNGGRDVLYSSGSGSYFGGAGSDVIHAASGTPEFLDGGVGIDTLDVSSWSFDYVVNLETGETNYTGESFVNFENLVAGAGNDTLQGSTDANLIRGGAGDDTITGRGGNDTVEGGAGADDLNGGAGIDTLLFTGFTPVTVSLTTNTGSGGDAEGDTYVNFENVTGGGGADTLIGSSGANVLTGGGGADTLSGRGGNDTIEGGSGGDSLNGGAGIDTLLYTGITSYTVSLATGTASGGDATGDTFVNFENLTTGGGDDVLTGSSGANVIRAGAGIDTVSGGAGDDRLFGEGGADVLNGGAGEDRLLGEGGADVLNGGQGNDVMRGGPGDDTYRVGNAGDMVVELANEGRDRVRADIDFTLPDHVEELVMGALATVGTGNGLDNQIQGNGNSDTIDGRAGNDRLYGYDGDDTLIGRGGEDWLVGGAGLDTLVGGDDRDVFVFDDGDTGATRNTADRITQFEQSVDTIRLRPMDADTTVAGDQNFSFIGSAAFSGVAGQLRYSHVNNFTYVEGDTNGDGTADFFIRINGIHALITSDFTL